MGRPRLYVTSVERKAAWRRRHGMAVRPHYPSAAAKQAAYRARKRQTAGDLANRECAAIQQALRMRALADQSWELNELIDTCCRDPDMPRRGPGDRPVELLAGGSAHFYGVAAARVRRHRWALQRLAQVRAVRGAQASGQGAARADEFIPLKSSAATGSDGPGNYAGHSRVPSPDRGRPPSTGGSDLSRYDNV